jgi:hypothetical protein
MPLSQALRQAASISANEVLFEWLDAVIDDPLAVLDGDELGSTFQDYLSPDMLPEADARRLLAELPAWDPGDDDGSHARAVERYQQAQFAAAIDIARALIALACEIDRVPAPLANHVDDLAPLVAVVRRAIETGEFDEEGVDFDALIDG